MLISDLLPADSPRSDREDLEHIRVMAEAGNTLPPIIVHRPTMRVVDGMHRLRAARLRGEDKIAVRFFDGDERDAFVLAVKLNVAHGLPLSAADRAAAARRIIRSHPDWSDRAIAAVAGLSDKTIKEIRTAAGGEAMKAVVRVGRDGRRRPVDSALGRVTASEWIEKRPNASSREIARLAGISPATVRDVRNRLDRGEGPLSASQQRARTKSSEPRAAGRRKGEPLREESSTEDFSKALDRLMKDPSLKRTEKGRALLRSLSFHSFLQKHQAQLAEVIPQHQARMVSELARTCASVWLRLAEEAEEIALRMQET
ncbi:streptomycin biosynthesis protein [Actinomadura sp. KC216]|uniref:ParB/RepB/Spo0J family partition protein n=1 Tax=Actinomadura sp. KC216 TaxID=2530370 RepID=UPI00105021C3|nr:ParB/RepB/Spo0J family partition protein [Actinomadura sp. KC216]TDB81291.1 streptomycin biosynthesis protein [Actinomadura sp. KC216]